MSPTRLAAAVTLAAALPLAAADPPAPHQSLHPTAGYVEVRLSGLTDKALTVRLAEVEPSTRYRRSVRLNVVEKDHDYKLADDVRFRRHELPPGPDGKPRQYSQDEYRKLREPAGAPGFQAQKADFHAGQVVRLWF